MATSLIDRLNQSPATSQEIQKATGLSQPVVSRQLASFGDRVVRIKQGRAVLYHLTQNRFGVDDKIPLFAIDKEGRSETIAYVRPLLHGGFFVEPVTDSPLLLGEAGTGLQDYLPYFIDDLRPDGFIGRQIARKLAEISPEYPSDPRLWTSEHVGRYLISNGDDLPGNLLFGYQTHLRIRQKPKTVTTEEYPALADVAMKGEIPGSSAGGEQAKSTAYNQDRGHVIVKFSPPGNDPISRRMCDILITEFYANKVLLAGKIPAAEAKLFEKGTRLFLESRRFDRIGKLGRRSMLSLDAVDSEYAGTGGNWITAMETLNHLGMVNREDVLTTKKLWAFGRLINNTDMHLGNLSLSMDQNKESFRLLPIYDMCSMGFAPRAGEAVLQEFSLPAIEKESGLSKSEAAAVQEMANEFWAAVVGDERLSDELRDHLVDGLELEPESPQL